MRKLFVFAAAAFGVLGSACLAAAAPAAGEAAARITLDSSSLGLALIGAAIGMGLASAGCGIGQGLGLKSACEGVARNPDASGKIMGILILGLALIESLAIYSLIVNLIILFMNPFV